MAYVALYRKWRPQDFDSVVGQEHIVRTLTNAIERNKVAHAYLFSGPRGTGKTSTAKILAKALNCIEGPTVHPCGVCEACRKITEGASMDVLEIDAASNRGIDEIRGLRETVGFLPVDGRYKVYIIDEVHMLTTEAFNALLKTLEEPPPHILFILATTEPHKIPATIHSRCQRYDFHRISAADIEARLADIVDKMSLSVEADALKLIATAAEGGMRDALSILDQCLTVSDDTVRAGDVEGLLGMVGHTWVARLADTAIAKDARQTLLTFTELLASGKDARQMLVELAEYLRNVLICQVAPMAVDAVLDRDVLARQAKAADAEELSRMIKRLYESAQESKFTTQPRISAEVALIDICMRQYGDSDIDKLTARIADLEDRLASGKLAVATPPRVVPGGANVVQTSSSVAQVQTRPIPEAPSQVSTPASRAAEGTTSSPTPKVTVTTYRAPMPPSRAAAVPPPPTTKQTPTKPSAGASASTAGYGDIWNSVLESLLSSGKRSAYACVAKGRIKEITEHSVTVAFEGKFVKERAEKDDYRTMLEEILLRVIGRNVRLNCVQEAAPTTPPPNPHAKYPHAVQEAIKMFGDNITVTRE